MDFPQVVDCVIDGTGPVESIISASLSVLGKQVLHIDRNQFYGGLLASLRFSELDDFLNQPCQLPEPYENLCLTDRILNLKATRSSLVTHKSSFWFLKNEENGFPNSDSIFANNLSSNFPVNSDSVVLSNDNSNEISNADVRDESDNQSDATEQINSKNIQSNHSIWSCSKLSEAMHRSDLDIFPKILYAESPTITAFLRADVTRYLEFRFVNRLLAYTTRMSSEDSSNSEQQQDNAMTTDVPNLNTVVSKIVQIPLCRSEVFKTRLLNLRQKRALCSFFEWCFHLPLDSSHDSLNTGSSSEQYSAYSDRPFQEFLNEKRNMDTFTQQFLITNLALGNFTITTKNAIKRIRQLLFSMNRFGQYPILWPLYGCGDIAQAYCRMSAVFGATFCLNCSIDKIIRLDSQMGDIEIMNQASVDRQNSSSCSTNRLLGTNLCVCLSNGQEINTKSIILGPESLPDQWICNNVKQWCARAILITTSSLLPDGRKPVDVSMLAIPLSGRGNEDLDPAILFEYQVEQNRNTPDNLFVVHLCATITIPMDPVHVFQSIQNRLFTKYGDSNTVDENSDRPQILWAGYFCIPDLSTISYKPSTNSSISKFEGLYLAPGYDLSTNLDSTALNAEEIFGQLAPQLGLSIRRNEGSQIVHSPGDSVNTHPPTLITPNDNHPGDNTSTTVGTTISRVTNTINTTSSYLSLDANWDGLFPPRPPRPEEIIVPSENDETNTVNDNEELT